MFKSAQKILSDVLVCITDHQIVSRILLSRIPQHFTKFAAYFDRINKFKVLTNEKKIFCLIEEAKKFHEKPQLK